MKELPEEKERQYEKETTKEISVFHPAENQLMGMMNYNPADDKMLSFYDVMPTFDTDPNFDYISGPNHYYRRVAQRFTLPADQKLSISNLSTWLGWFATRLHCLVLSALRLIISCRASTSRWLI